MKRSLLIAFLLISEALSAQVPTCIDSIRINPYHTCYISYDPVCGCDSNTYRNYCFAYNKAGIVNWVMGICHSQNFDIDIVPVPVQYEPLVFSAAFRVPSSCYVFITDIYGAIVYNITFYTSYDNEIKTFEINTDSFLNGVYCLFAVVNGEQKFKKFLKVKY